jgi:hypothetical protein
LLFPLLYALLPPSLQIPSTKYRTSSTAAAAAAAAAACCSQSVLPAPGRARGAQTTSICYTEALCRRRRTLWGATEHCATLSSSYTAWLERRRERERERERDREREKASESDWVSERVPPPPFQEDTKLQRRGGGEERRGEMNGVLL